MPCTICSCSSSNSSFGADFHTAALRSLLVPSEHNAGAQGEPGKHLLSTEQPHNITQCLCDEAAPHIGEEHMGVAQPTRGTYCAHIHSSEDQSDRHEDPITTHGLSEMLPGDPTQHATPNALLHAELVGLGDCLHHFPAFLPTIAPRHLNHTHTHPETPRHPGTPPLPPHTHTATATSSLKYSHHTTHNHTLSSARDLPPQTRPQTAL